MQDAIDRAGSVTSWASRLIRSALIGSPEVAARNHSMFGVPLLYRPPRTPNRPGSAEMMPMDR